MSASSATTDEWCVVAPWADGGSPVNGVAVDGPVQGLGARAGYERPARAMAVRFGAISAPLPSRAPSTSARSVSTCNTSTVGDVTLAEPKALLGFAGPTVIKNTIRADLPEGFQRSEFLLAHGFLDRVVNRIDQKATITQLLEYCRVGVRA